MGPRPPQSDYLYGGSTPVFQPSSLSLSLPLFFSPPPPPPPLLTRLVSAFTLLCLIGATLCSSSANPLILRDMEHARPADTGAETRRQFSSHLRAHFCPRFSRFHVLPVELSHSANRTFLFSVSPRKCKNCEIAVTSGSVNIDTIYLRKITNIFRSYRPSPRIVY